MISLKNVSKSFGNHAVLKDISWEFLPGKVYGIVGENGAGKTTLFRSIVGLENFEGEINAPGNDFKKRTGYLPTEPYSLPKITGEEHVRLLCNARGKQILDWEKANLFELPLNRFVDEYSTGMKKKLALNAILLQQNDYFILDEPFNGVDLQSNLIISNIIDQLKQQQKTIVLSSHIFSTLKESCDEILWLQHGSIKECFTKNQFALLEGKLKTEQKKLVFVNGEWNYV